MLVADGVIPAPSKRPSRYQFHWKYGSIGGIVLADDKSTGRAMIKRDLGLSKNTRLPKEVEIVRVENEDQRTCSETGFRSEDGRAEDSQSVGGSVATGNGSGCPT